MYRNKTVQLLVSLLVGTALAAAFWAVGNKELAWMGYVTVALAWPATGRCLPQRGSAT